MENKTILTVEGNNAKQIKVISPKRELHVINPNTPKKSAVRKAKLRKQHTVGKLCLLFTAVCLGVGATILPEASTLGILFLLPGIMLTFSRKVW